MADFYIGKITTARHPNVVRELNKARRKDKKLWYTADYISKRGKIDPIGYYETESDARKAIKRYAVRLNTSTISIHRTK